MAAAERLATLNGHPSATTRQSGRIPDASPVNECVASAVRARLKVHHDADGGGHHDRINFTDRHPDLECDATATQGGMGQDREHLDLAAMEHLVTLAPTAVPPNPSARLDPTI